MGASGGVVGCGVWTSTFGVGCAAMASCCRWSARGDRSAKSPRIFGEDEHPPSPDKIGWWWKRTRKLAGIDSAWRLHDLRHWSATHAIAGGHNVRSVAARLGHADPTTTMRTYAHALEGFDQGIADTVAGVLDGDQADR